MVRFGSSIRDYCRGKAWQLEDLVPVGSAGDHGRYDGEIGARRAASLDAESRANLLSASHRVERSSTDPGGSTPLT